MTVYSGRNLQLRLTMLYFFHGLESGPHGAKYLAMSEAFGAVVSPDFQGMDLEARLAHAEAATRGQTDAVIVGSSFGGLVGAILAHRYPERIAALVLLAPALHNDFSVEVTGFVPKTVVIHGTQDDVVPLEAVRAFCESRGVQVIEVDDGHRLASSIPLILDKIRTFLPSI